MSTPPLFWITDEERRRMAWGARLAIVKRGLGCLLALAAFGSIVSALVYVSVKIIRAAGQ